MSIHSVRPKSPVQAGDIVIRPKRSGGGRHYGTGLSDGRVAHTTPETGKTIQSLAEFSAGLPVFINRPNRTPDQKAVVQQRALSNLGARYIAADANCEHDMTMAQYGIPHSPTASNAKILALVGGSLLLLIAMNNSD